MSFYKEWKRNYNCNDNYYWESFLLQKDESTNELLYGSEEEIIEAIDFLINIPIEYFVEHVYALKTDFSITSRDIPQFSSIYDSTHGICKILKQKNNLTYKELGIEFNKTPTDYAWVKYGSEQGYLSTLFMLTHYSENCEKNKKISITNLGKIFVDLEDKKGDELIKRLCYRMRFFQLVITKLHEDNSVNIENLFCGLSGSTITRRKSSVKKIISIMFNENSYDFWLNKIM